MRGLRATLGCLALASAVASPAARAACEERGPGWIACPRSADGCRKVLELQLLDIDFQGKARDVTLFGMLHISKTDVALQRVAPAVQMLREQQAILIQDYNRCTISDDEYRAGRARQGSYESDLSEANVLSERIAALETQAARAGQDADALKKLRDALRPELDRLAALARSLSAKTLDHRLVMLERQSAEAAGQADRLVALERERSELEAAQTALVDRLDAEGAARLEAISTRIAELEARVSVVERRLTELSEHRLVVTHFILDLQASGTLLDGRLRPGLGLDFETLRPSGGFLSGFAVSGEVAGLQWSREATYQTLPGQQPVDFTQPLSLLTAEVGLKRYVVARQGLHLYAGVGAGFAFQVRDDWKVGEVVHASAGVVLYPLGYRAGLEVRGAAYRTQQAYVDFDPFGEARTGHRSAWQAGLSFGAFVSPVSW